MQKTLRHLLILALCFSTINFVHAASENLPDLGSPGLVLYDRDMEAELGRAFLTAIHTEYDMISDPVVVEYVRQIGEKIVSHISDGRNYRFFVINRPEINAFAGPNGIIGINTGLILAAQSEDELASVIAHEIAHITQEHLSRRFEQFEQGNITNLASLLAAILIGTQNPSAGLATFIGGSSLALQEQLRFSRIHEHEADSIGLLLLSKSGYNPSAMTRFFDALHQKHNHTSRPPEILLTHPVTERRSALSAARADQLSSVSEQHLSHGLIQSRLALEALNNRQILEENREVIKCYIKYLNAETHKNQATIKCLEKASKRHPDNRLIQLATAELLDKRNQNTFNLQQLNELYPQDNAIVLTTADHYSYLNQPDRAIAVLSSQLNHTHEKIELLSKISELYVDKQDNAHALYFQALREWEIGNLKRAKYLANSALDEPSTEVNLTLKINSLLKKINELQ